MQDFRYIIGVDAADEQAAIAEATHRLAQGEHILFEYHDYAGELPVVSEIKLAKSYDERDTAGPDFAVEIVAACHRRIPVRFVAGGEVGERVTESAPLSAFPNE